MANLQGYRAFVRTIEIGSFSGVGRELGISQSAVSKQIASLEADLGVQLFARTTRKVRPTDEALLLYPHVRQLMETLIGLKPTPLDGIELKASGTLRVALPSSFGRKCIMPLVPAFLAANPRLLLDIHLTNTMVDLIEEGVELAIHIGELPPSTLVARSLRSATHKLVATPAYLARQGRPDTPAALAEHNCLVLTGGASRKRWEFDSESGHQIIEVAGAVRANDVDAVYDAVLNDLGIAQIPDWVIGGDIAHGRVEWLLQDYFIAAQPIRFIYPQTRFLSLRARRFLDFMVEHLAPR